VLDRACEIFERNFILKALEQASWSVAAAGPNLDVPLSTMKHKVERLDVKGVARTLPDG
jgi:transcriptional regulator with GAF, ATPase, and Fis domain